MTEITDVGSEVVAQEVETHQVANEQPPQESQRRDEEMNWKRAREMMEEQKRQLEQMKERERLYQQELMKFTKPVTNEEPAENFADDDLLTAAQAKRVAEKIAEQKFKSLWQQTEDAKAEDNLRREFPDYDAVVTPENLQKLARENPEILESLQATPRLYAKGKTAYKFLKTMVNPDFVESKEKIQTNSAKPRSSSSLGASGALSQASLFERGLTPDLKKQLLEEMIQSAKKL